MKVSSGSKKVHKSYYQPQLSWPSMGAGLGPESLATTQPEPQSVDSVDFSLAARVPVRRRRNSGRPHRKSWPVGVPLPAGYMLYSFEKIVAGENCFREYRLLYQPTLWEDGQHIVQRSWGRRGSPCQSHLDRSFLDRAGALDYLKQQIVRRLARDYKLVSWEVMGVGSGVG